MKTASVELNTKVGPDWRRSPATLDPPSGVDDFIKRSNSYFAECADFYIRPTITGYALAVGLPGPTSLIRLGQRIPELRYVISRCMMAVASEYEDMMCSGNTAGPQFMLKNIPDFDPDEPVGAPAVQFFNDRKEVFLHTDVVGAARADSKFDNEDPLDTYVRLIRQKGYLPDNGEASVSVLSGAPKNTIAPRRALTILTEGWQDE